MQGKSLYAILLSIIAVLALALAVLVIFLFTTYNNMKTGSTASPTPTSQEAREVPPDEQANLNLYKTAEGTSADAIFNLKSSPAHDGSFLMASITLVYDSGSKKAKNPEDRAALLMGYQSELKQACIEYFRSLTFEDLSDDAAIEKARDTLKDNFNNILADKGKDKIIIRIIFDKWIVQ